LENDILHGVDPIPVTFVVFCERASHVDGAQGLLRVINGKTMVVLFFGLLFMQPFRLLEKRNSTIRVEESQGFLGRNGTIVEKLR
jgi:hypothetical protein